MKLQTLLERDFHAGQVKVGVRRLRIASAVPHIDPLVRVQDEEVHSIVPIAVEQRDIWSRPCG